MSDPIAHAAADIVMEALRANGIDPRKAGENEMMRLIVLEWVRGEMTRPEFDRSCGNMLIFCPSLALPIAAISRLVE